MDDFESIKKLDFTKMEAHELIASLTIFQQKYRNIDKDASIKIISNIVQNYVHNKQNELIDYGVNVQEKYINIKWMKPIIHKHAHGKHRRELRLHHRGLLDIPAEDFN